MNQKIKMLRQLLAAITVIVAIGGLSSCEKYSWIPEKINPDETIHFQAQIQPIFNKSCVSCHGPYNTPDLRDGYSYESLTTNGLVNQPGESSELYLKMTSSSHASRSTDVDKQLVLNWINQGALNN